MLHIVIFVRYDKPIYSLYTQTGTANSASLLSAMNDLRRSRWKLGPSGSLSPLTSTFDLRPKMNQAGLLTTAALLMLGIEFGVKCTEISQWLRAATGLSEDDSLTRVGGGEHAAI